MDESSMWLPLVADDEGLLEVVVTFLGKRTAIRMMVSSS
jgi:hypothetical protein